MTSAAPGGPDTGARRSNLHERTRKGGLAAGTGEGSLGAPERYPLNWHEESFWDPDALHAEMQRVFDICHTCRRCVSLCSAFPTLFDLVDESETLEVDSLTREDHLQVALGKSAAHPGVAPLVNWANRQPPVRALLEKGLGVHRERELPAYASRTFRSWARARGGSEGLEAAPDERTRGRVAVFGTCYINYQVPEVGRDLVRVMEHNGIPVTFPDQERCCGMPRLEHGDLAGAQQALDAIIPQLEPLVDAGWDIVAPVPSCVLMLKREYGMIAPDDERVARVAARVFDPFEYLWHRHQEGRLNTDFASGLGRIAYHAPCHQRVQNIGAKTRQVLELVPDTEVSAHERCSGHDGTWGVKVEWFESSMKIGRPLFRQVNEAEPDYYSSDCPIAGNQIRQGAGREAPPAHPLTLLRQAYGLAGDPEAR